MMRRLRRKNDLFMLGHFARRSSIEHAMTSEGCFENLKYSTELQPETGSEMSGAEFQYAAKEVIELFHNSGKG
ncbi:MAG: hypothetical protein R3C56_09190 [Pirellulaceae bacterium]